MAMLGAAMSSSLPLLPHQGGGRFCRRCFHDEELHRVLKDAAGWARAEICTAVQCPCHVTLTVESLSD